MGFYEELYNRWQDTSHIAIEHEDVLLSYEELDRRVRRICAFLLDIGVEKGDVIATQLPKSTLLLEVILAGMAMGCPVLPLNDAYTPTEAHFYLEDAQARVFVGSYTPDIPNLITITTHSDLYQQEPMHSLPHVDPDELAILLYTSGTTGIPKGAMISHTNILATVEGLCSAWCCTSTDRLLHMLPLFHVHGLFVAQFVALYAQCTSIWMSSFERDSCLSLLHTKDITIMMAVPTIYFRLLSTEETHHYPKLRLCTSGSAPLPVPIHERFQKQFGITIVERYGMTEVGIVLSNPYHGEKKIGTVGLPVSRASFRIVNMGTLEDCAVGDVGELWISGPSVISGYLRRPEQTAQTIVGTWLRSGDLAQMDADGYIKIAGRAKDLVISGGYNIYPLEIEALFLEHPLVEQAAGVGIPDEEWGERFVMLIIPKEGLDIDDLKRIAREKLASYKRPKEFIVVHSFPRNAMGKVQKAIIRAQLIESRSS